MASVLAGYGYAALTATGQTYTGCLSKGLLTSVAVGDAPLTACKKGETKISWNEEGQQGPQGIQGPQGPAGPAGSLSDLGSINGLPCTRAGLAGHAMITAASDTGVAEIGCVVGEPQTLDEYNNTFATAANIGTLNCMQSVEPQGTVMPVGSSDWLKVDY